jgi:hypothetical protein
MYAQKILLVVLALSLLAAFAVSDATAQSRRRCSGSYGAIVPQSCLDNPQAWLARVQKRKQQQLIQQGKQPN